MSTNGIPNNIYDDQAAIQRSVNADKGHLTRWENACKSIRRIVVDQENGTDHEIKQLRDASIKFSDKVEVMVNKYVRMIELDGGVTPDLEAALNSEMNELSKRETRLLALVSETAATFQELNKLPAGDTPGRAPGDAPAESAKAKAKSELKPDSLTDQFSPAEFAIWCDQVHLYFTASKFDLLSRV